MRLVNVTQDNAPQLSKRDALRMTRVIVNEQVWAALIDGSLPDRDVDIIFRRLVGCIWRAEQVALNSRLKGEPDENQGATRP